MSPEILDVSGRQQPPENILIKNGGTFPCDARKESFDNITRKNFVISSAEINDGFTVVCTAKDTGVRAPFLSLLLLNYFVVVAIFLSSYLFCLDFEFDMTVGKQASLLTV